MANLKEWIKGISFTLFGALMYYFLWDNVFSNILSFVTNNGITTTTNGRILGAIAWVSFVLLYIMTVPVYFIYSVIVGSGREQQTHPLELLKAIGSWSILMPVFVIITAIMETLIGSLPVITGTAQNLATGQEVTWSNADILSGVSTFGWFMTLIAIIGLVGVPFFFILKGYGQIKDEGEGGNR